MEDFLKVFSFNFLSDIDNIIILGAILRRHAHLNIAIAAAITLTITRTLYIIVLSEFANVPFVHLLSGAILLFIAFQLVSKFDRKQVSKRSSNSIIYKGKVLLLLAITDFLICLDSVLVISKISQQMFLISIAIFFSLLISLYFLPYIVNISKAFSWMNILIGGFIAQTAVLSISNEPFIAYWLASLNANKMPAGVNIETIFAHFIVILFVLLGIMTYFNEQRITKIK